MVMTRPPAFHIWKFLMKNMTSPNSGLITKVSLILANKELRAPPAKPIKFRFECISNFQISILFPNFCIFPNKFLKSSTTFLE